MVPLCRVRKPLVIEPHRRSDGRTARFFYSQTLHIHFLMLRPRSGVRSAACCTQSTIQSAGGAEGAMFLCLFVRTPQLTGLQPRSSRVSTQHLRTEKTCVRKISIVRVLFLWWGAASRSGYKKAKRKTFNFIVLQLMMADEWHAALRLSQIAMMLLKFFMIRCLLRRQGRRSRWLGCCYNCVRHMFLI